MTRRVRWACPNGCPAVLASTRPRRDDVARYCLPCSARTGRLVQRSTPALDAERQQRHARQLAKIRAVAARGRAKDAARYTVGGVDMRELLRDAWGLPVAREWRARRRLRDEVPAMRLRRCTQILSVRGRAWPSRHALTVSVMPGEPPPVDTLLHEVAHILVGRDQEGGWHGSKFQACLSRMHEQWAKGHPGHVRVTDFEHLPEESSDRSPTNEGTP